ncbi:MAG: hypothetical protein J5654_00130 [Victivallales bacterium]|nr:hypothetical protein [Victivallales bacterium]
MSEIIEASPFHFSSVREPLAQHNARWEALLRNWHERGGVSWTPGVIVLPELRECIETFLPWREFACSLRSVARAFLPSETWVPHLLQDGTLESILEFWEELPQYSGRVNLDDDELLPFFCACADPPRFGTDIGRYPRQLETLRQMKPRSAGRLLDLGCGIGLGTLEAVAELGCAEGVGITLEPLEAWMAEMRNLPHDMDRTSHFEPFSQVKAHFVADDVLAYAGEGGFSVILCNGLAGGRFMQKDEQFHALLRVLRSQLAPNGVVALANAFHEGQRHAVQRFLALAREIGWEVAGNWQNAWLKR